MYGSATEQKRGVAVVEQDPGFPFRGSLFQIVPPVTQMPSTFVMHFPDEFFDEIKSSLGIVARPTVS